MLTKVKTDDEIKSMREAGGMLAAVLSLLDRKTESGMTGLDVAEIAKKELEKLGGKPSFLGYEGFPSVICISLNDEVVHGIPNDREFKDGDLVSYDFGVTVNGMITDSAFTKALGRVPDNVQQLLEKTEQSLMAGIDVAKNGAHTGDIGAAIERILKSADLGIVRDLVGHGVGHHVHEEPNFPNYGTPGTGSMIKTGMTIALEPMATLGTHKVGVDQDGWTIRTQDGSLSAHFEHTLLVTDSGAEILTPRDS
ncbi:MAG: type I methionyl aminopeptidase [Candidatus Saccharimonadales bacterium]|nr:type I methionyl aminopeptidase [Candidatus Saccharimonadales bacterium]